MIMMPVINETDEKSIAENLGTEGEGEDAISIIENTKTPNWDEHR